MRHVVVVGGGLAGLTAAIRLAAVSRVTLLEALPRLGGQIWTEREAGFVIERGAEGFVARSEALPRLAAQVGLADALIGQSVDASYGFDGSLTALAPGEAARFLGFQVPAGDLGRGIKTFRQGMGSLVDACEQTLRARAAATIRCSVRAVSLQASASRVSLLLGDEQVTADAAVIATTAARGAALLGGIAGAAARPLAAAPTLSSVTVELAYEREAVPHPLDGTGFVVAEDQQRHGLRACTFTSCKFAGRAPPGRTSLRLFFRPGGDDLARLDDAAWQERARDALARVLGVRAVPLGAWVTRWPSALPVFSAAHRGAVAALESALAPFPIALAGAAFHGSGIDAAVRSGEQAADRLLRQLA